MFIIIEFIKKYWTILLPLIAVWIVYFMFVSLENERDDALKQLSDIKATMASQKAANDKALEKAKNDQVENEHTAQQQIENLHIDKTTLTNAIKGYYNAPSHPKPAMATNVGIVLPQSASGGSTETPTSTEGLTEGERECRSASAGLQAKIKTLEDALATETVDFNRARARVDRDCEQIGCLTD